MSEVKSRPAEKPPEKAAATAPERTAIAPVLAMPEIEAIRVLQNSLYPGAQENSVRLVLAWCRATGRDPMRKPVHIVPMSVKIGHNKYEWRDILMPGIGLYRTDAAQSGEYVGKSEPEFGPDITEVLGGVRVTYPEWCRITVSRLKAGKERSFTAKEYWIENYSTAGRDTEAPNTMWKRRPRGQIAKCFDAETQVLTDRGFEPFAGVTGRVLQVGPTGLEPTDAVPFSQDYDGEMIVADGTRLNFSVTPNHDMVTNLGRMEAGTLYDQATAMSGKLTIPRCAASARPEADVPDYALQLAGYFMADGSHTGFRQFRIAVSRQHKVEALREIGMYQSETLKADAGRIAVVAGRQIVTKLDKVCFTYPFELIAGLVTPDKQVLPDAILNLSVRQARIFVDAILAFDGSVNQQGTRRLSQRNPGVLRGFALAAVHAGLSVSGETERLSDIGSASSVTVSESAHFPVVRGLPKNSASLVKRRNVNGTVWCVTVPSGVIVVRRHGFSMLCGNCTEAQALRQAFPEQTGNTVTADEMEGRDFDGVTIESRSEPNWEPEAKGGAQQEDEAAQKRREYVDGVVLRLKVGVSAAGLAALERETKGNYEWLRENDPKQAERMQQAFAAARPAKRSRIDDLEEAVIDKAAAASPAGQDDGGLSDAGEEQDGNSDAADPGPGERGPAEKVAEPAASDKAASNAAPTKADEAAKSEPARAADRDDLARLLSELAALGTEADAGAWEAKRSTSDAIADMKASRPSDYAKLKAAYNQRLVYLRSAKKG